MVEIPEPVDDANRRFEDLLDRLDEDPEQPVEALLAEYTALAPNFRARLEKLRLLEFLPDPTRRFESIASETLLVNRYRVHYRCGMGGMGVVYRAFDEKLGCAVAIKIMRGALADADQVTRFQNEAMRNARLDHPGILPIHDRGSLADGRPYYVMKFVTGKTLLEHIEARASDATSAFVLGNLEATLGWIEQVCDALDCAHSHGIVHRDLKPSNVMVGSFSEVYIVDWGLAFELRSASDQVGGPIAPDRSPAPTLSLTADGGMPGTPAYMAPEQARGARSELSPATDVFAVGAILHHLWFGRPPIRAATRDDAPELQVGRGLVLDIAPRPRGFPRELYAICRKSLAIEPRDRFPDALRLRDDIRAYRSDRPGGSWRDPALTRVTKWIRRHPTLAATIGATLLLSALGLSGAFLAFKLDRERIANARTRFENSIRSVATSPPQSDSTFKRPQHAETIRRSLAAFAAGGFDLADFSRSSADLARAIDHAGWVDAEFGRELVNALLDLELWFELGHFGFLSRPVIEAEPRPKWPQESRELDAYLRANHSDLIAVAPRISELSRTLASDDWDRSFADVVRYAFGQRKGIVDRFRELAVPREPDRLIRGAQFAALFEPLREDTGHWVELAWRERIPTSLHAMRISFEIERGKGAQANPDRLLFQAIAAIGLAPEDPENWSRFGIAQIDARRYDGATVAFERALELAPDRENDLVNLAVVEERRDRPRETVCRLDVALQLAPDNLTALAMRMVNRRRLSNLAGAESDYRRYRNLPGNERRPRSVLAFEYSRRGNHARASELLQDLVDDRMAQPSDLVALAEELRELCRPVEASAYCDRALSVLLRDPDADLTRARIWRDQGLLHRAIETCLTLDLRSSAEANTVLAEALFDVGQAEEALAAFENALEIDHELVAALVGRTLTLHALGRDEAALGALLETTNRVVSKLDFERRTYGSTRTYEIRHEIDRLLASLAFRGILSHCGSQTLRNHVIEMLR